MKKNKEPKKAKINCCNNQLEKKSDIKNEILDVLKNFWPKELTKKEIIKALLDKGVDCADGTFYNVISVLGRQNRIIIKRSSGAFYKYNQLKNEKYPIGVAPSKVLTENGFVNNVLELIKANGFEEICRIHDIHLKTDFWEVDAFQDLRQRSCEVWRHQSCYCWQPNKKSKSWKVNLFVGYYHRVTFQVYSCGVLTCSVKCIRTPFPANLEGLRTLQRIISEACLIIFDDRKFWSFPPVDNWVVSFWHYGRDSKTKFKVKFEVTFKSFFGGLARLYVRKKDGRLRLEEFQSPCEPLGLLLHEAEINSKENFSIYSHENGLSKKEEKIDQLIENRIDTQLKKIITSFLVQTFKN